jgi:hypothetical protein
MRRKIDMWQELDEHVPDFLPEVDVQEAQTAVADVRERLDKVEAQLLSQYTAMAAYAQIAQQSVETARAEARADLDREKGILVSLVERTRNELHVEHGGGEPGSRIAMNGNVDAVARIAELQERFESINQLFSQCLRNQEELANSIASLLERQMRDPDVVAPAALGESSADADAEIADATHATEISDAGNEVDHVIEMMALH